MPNQVQSALDALIAYYKSNALRPHIDVSGNPMEIVESLVTQVRQNLPQDQDQNARIVLNYMIQDIVDYCRATRSTYLSLTYQFGTGPSNKGNV